jgi:hypothetical protein
MTQPDPQVEQALLYAAGHDSNVNVRLSAVDALEKYAADPNVRRVLCRPPCLSQDSPLAQVALIDLVVKSKDRDCASVAAAPRRPPGSDEAVRQRAQWAHRSNWELKENPDEERYPAADHIARAAGGARFRSPLALWKTRRPSITLTPVEPVTSWWRITSPARFTSPARGSQIEVTMVRHNRADSAEKLAEAKREVKLEITEQGGEVKLHQDGPFRDHHGISFHGDHD